MKGLAAAAFPMPRAKKISFHGLNAGESPWCVLLYATNAIREEALRIALEHGYAPERDANDETALVWR